MGGHPLSALHLVDHDVLIVAGYAISGLCLSYDFAEILISFWKLVLRNSPTNRSALASAIRRKYSNEKQLSGVVINLLLGKSSSE